MQTYPWHDPIDNSEVPSGLSGDSELNYVLYKEMTDGHSLPVNPDAVLSYSGNWTNGRILGDNAEITDFGTFALSRENFITRYLIPKLRGVNAAIEARVSNLNIVLEQTSAFSYIYRWYVSVYQGYTEVRHYLFPYTDSQSPLGNARLA